jgi:hypothetical protein
MLTRDQEEVFLHGLRYDLAKSDRNEVAKRLREAAKHNYALPPDIVSKLADMIDPDKPQRLGRKPKDGANAIRDYEALRVWILASFDKELARFLMNQGKIAFHLCQDIKHISNWAEGKTFAPVWKHQDMHRTREQTSYPSQTELKKYVCAVYGNISGRYLDSLVKKHKNQVRAGWFVTDWFECPEQSPHPFGWWNP